MALHEQDTRERWSIKGSMPERVMKRIDDYTSVGDRKAIRMAEQRDADEVPNSKPWTLDPGPQTLDPVPQTLDPKL